MTQARQARRTVQVRTTDWDNPYAVELRSAMTAEVQRRYDGERPPVLVPIDPAAICFTGLAWVAGEPVGHVALRRLGPDLELKRLFVVPGWRDAGVGRALLLTAEATAVGLGGSRIVLRTGDRQPEAIALYLSAGYLEVAVFAPYLDFPHSRCFAKQLAPPGPAADDRTVTP